MFLHNLYTIVNTTTLDEETVVTVLLNGDSPVYRAHFPGNPITPGACLLEMGRELASAVVKKDLSLEKADNIKFLKAIHPLQTPRVEFRMQVQWQEHGSWKVRTEVMDGDLVMTRMTLWLRETISA